MTALELPALDIYSAVTGNQVNTVERGGQVRVICPSVEHRESRASCDVRPVDGVWRCRSCNAGGGKFDLVIAAGQARDRAGAARWLEERFNLTKGGSHVVRPRPPSPRTQFERELERIMRQRERYLGYRPPVRSFDMNRAAANVERACGIQLPRVAVEPFEIAPHEDDPAWKTLFERRVRELMIANHEDPQREPTGNEAADAAVLAAQDLRELARASDVAA
jgi:hypothetical protein